jgi:DNA-binding response OmpR family regulator
MLDKMKDKVLIIDDDPKLCRLLTEFLSGFGFTVHAALTPDEGFKKLRRHKPDMVVLDVMLPQMNGFDVCKKIRLDSNVPIIMLTARGEPMDRIVGLELGADDYLAKPFEPRELVARIQAVLRRSSRPEIARQRRFGRLTIDPNKRIAMLDQTKIELTTNEFTALWLLARHPGQVLDRDRILQELRGIDSDAFNRSVDITMSRIRQKLGDDPKSPTYIKTVWGTGYVFIGEAEPDGETTDT